MSNTKIARNWVPPQCKGEVGLRATIRIQHSFERWKQFGYKLAERKAALRTANRRFRVHNGLSLKGA